MKIQTSMARFLLAGATLLALAASPLARADYSATVQSQGPVGYWRLNETVQPQNIPGAANSGSLGSSALGTYNNFITRGLTGPFTGSSAIGLDGSSQYVSTPWQAGLNTAQFSFEVWVNPAVVPKFAYMCSSVEVGNPRSGWYFAQDDGSTFGLGSAFVFRMFYQHGVNGADPAVTLYAPVTTAGVWYHLVVTYNGTTATLYTNGVPAMSDTPLGYVPNTDQPTTFGCRSSLNFFWPGEQAEVAMYNTALSGPRVAAHYTAATTAPGTYAATVGVDAPVLYWRFQEPADPPAADIGSLGAAGNGLYLYDTKVGSPGPRPPTFPGFDAGNNAASFDAGGGVVRLPGLNLNNNNVTICGWISATGAQNTATGLIVCNSGGTTAGLIIDPVFGGLGLGYVWNGSTAGWSPSSDTGLPMLPDSAWAYAAMVIQPASVTLYICDNNYGDWASASPQSAVSHPVQTFSGPTLIGAGYTGGSFKGAIDEVAIFNRALSQGELYTEFATAVGGVPPRIFTDLQGPSGPVAAGDPLVLTVDAGGTPPLSYAWHRNGGTVATTTSGTYTVASAGLGDAGTYDVLISGTGSPAQSQSVVVSVVTPTQPAIVGTTGFTSRTLYPTGTLAMAVSATGGGLKYQWYKNTVPISSATQSAFTIARVGTGDAGSYSIYITNSVGHATNGPVTITIPSPTGYAALIVASAPEAWWRLDEASGTNMFDGMGRHDGTYTNLNGTGPLPVLGAGGIADAGDPAVSFGANGGVGYVPFSPALNNSQGYTYEAWVKTTALGAFQIPISSVDGNGGIWWAMYTGGSAPRWEPGATGGVYDIYTTGGDVFNAMFVASGVWTHLVMIYNPNNGLAGFPWQFYINGTTDGFVWQLGANTLNTTAPFVIGGAADPAPVAGSYFNGQVDEVAVYNRALSATEISNHWVVGFPPSPPTFNPPFLPQTVTVGKSVSFSTLVQGTTPIRLQWYKGSTLLSGQTNNSFAIASTALSDTATYTLWATNSAGTNSQSVSLTVIDQTAYANVTNGLVLHLRFDGNTSDTSGRGNNGTAVGGPTFVPGIIGAQALHYSTTTTTNYSPTNVTASAESYVTLGTPTDLQFGSSTSWSASLWVKLPSGYVSGDLPFIGTGVGSMNNPGWDIGPTYGGGGWQWCLNDGVTVQATTNNIDVNGASGSINDGNWHNFVLVVDRSAQAANTYLDGVFYGGGNIAALGSVDNGHPVVIGQDPTFAYPSIPTGASQTDLNTWGTSPSATLDDIGIWRRALTALEVAQIQSAGATAGHSFDTVGPVVLTISRSGANVVISWSNGTLLQSDNIGPTASWSAVPGATAPSYTVAPSAAKKFYRVQVP